MKLLQITLTLVAVLSIGLTANAQLSLGDDCGCPDLASRTQVNLSDLTDAQGNFPAGATTFTCDNIYFIDEKSYVGPGAELYIQAGTVLRGVFGLTVDSNALIISRDGKIYANGTDCCPIIFTDENDPLDGSYSVDIRGQWGSLIVLGNAPNNLLLADGDLAVGDGVGNVEGLLPGDSRNHYGGDDPNDSSGVLRYVSLRHGGTDIGEANEINGLTLGSVGRGTVIEYIEVLSNDDDGVEFFGGTVDAKHITVMFCNDDYIDWDQGYVGRLQYVYGLQLPENGTLGAQGDEAFEIDGDDQDSGNLPYSDPTVYNATMIGRGANRGVLAKEFTRGHIANSIFCNFASGVDLDQEADRPGETAFDNFQSGDLTFSNNAFDMVDNLLTVQEGTPAPAAELTAFTDAGNALVPGIIDFEYAIDENNTVTGAVNPVPTIDVTSPETPPVDGFFEPVNFKGAFKPGATPWTSGWTLSQLLGVDNSIVDCPTDVDRDGDTDVDDFLQLIGAFNTTCGN